MTSSDLQKFYGSLFLWMFLPSLLTNWSLKVVHFLLYGVRRSPPPRGSKTYQRHYRITYAVIVGAYLLIDFYSIQQSVTGLSNFYTRSGVRPGPSFNPRVLKSTYRKASVKYHPDKNPSERAQVEYAKIKAAYEVLSHPLKRNVYDRFGVEAIQECVGCKTYRDFFMQAGTNNLGFYLGTGIVLVILGGLHKQYGQYWRVLGFLAMMTLEATMLVRDHEELWWMDWIYPNQTAFEKIRIFHQIFLTLTVAMSQLGPVLFPETKQSKEDLLQEVKILTALVRNECAHHLKSAFKPFVKDSESMVKLTRKMDKIACDMNLMEADQEYAKAVQNVMTRTNASMATRRRKF